MSVKSLQYDEKKDLELGPVHRIQEGVINDAVFGEVGEDGPNYRAVSSVSGLFYRNTSRCIYSTLWKISLGRILTRWIQVGWKGGAALMLKTQIGLGVLSIPAAFDTLHVVLQDGFYRFLPVSGFFSIEELDPIIRARWTKEAAILCNET